MVLSITVIQSPINFFLDQICICYGGSQLQAEFLKIFLLSLNNIKMC
jgi:hypothetical protein